MIGNGNPNPVCYVSGLPQALFVVEKNQPFLKRRALGSPNGQAMFATIHACRKRFFCLTTCLFWKRCVFVKKLICLVNIGQYLSNICQYLSIVNRQWQQATGSCFSCRFVGGWAAPRTITPNDDCFSSASASYKAQWLFTFRGLILTTEAWTPVSGPWTRYGASIFCKHQLTK